MQVWDTIHNRTPQQANILHQVNLTHAEQGKETEKYGCRYKKRQTDMKKQK